MTIEQLPYGEPVRNWLKDRYGEAEADRIWAQTKENYRNYLLDLPDYGGSRNGHAKAIYGGLLIFALYPALPDRPPISELQDFVQNLFMGPFTKLGKIFDLNRPSNMRLIDNVFRKSGNRDRKDILRYPDGFINIDAPYDTARHAAGYSFTQCPNAEFAKKHGLLHVLPLLCNSDFFGIGEIHRALGYAFKTGLLDLNPADRVDLPKKNVFETEPYTEKEIMQLFEAVKDTPLELIVILTAFYGLRREEVLGLKWNAVDFDKHTITIKNVVTEAYLDGKCQLVEKNRTKTKSSFRTLPLVPQIESLLRRAKAQQEEYRELCGDCYNTAYLDYVNVNPMGDLIKPGYVSQQFPIFLKRAGLRKIRFHDLRHSCATLMYAKGVQLKDMQIWLGHSTISTTSNIYTHLDFDSKVDSANAILGVLTEVRAE